jgi:peptidylprolyl isomerase
MLLRLFRKKQKNPYGMPSWLKAILIIMVLYLVMQGVQMDEKSIEENSTQKVLKEAGEAIKAQKTINFAEYKELLFPDYDAMMRVQDVEVGKGQLVICGQKVSIAYTLFRADNSLIDGSVTKEKPAAFLLGEGKVMPALEQGVIGMRVGGKRSIFSPPNMAHGIKEFARNDVASNENIRFEVEMLSASPEFKDIENIPYRVVDVRKSSGPMLMCGQKGNFNVTIWDTKGTKLYSSADAVKQDTKPTDQTANSNKEASIPVKGLSFTPGKSEVFMGLEQGVVGMPMGGMRTLVVPPAFLRTTSGAPPAIQLPLPEGQTVLVDVEYLP